MQIAIIGAGNGPAAAPLGAASASSLLPVALWLVPPRHDDSRRISIPRSPPNAL